MSHIPSSTMTTNGVDHRAAVTQLIEKRKKLESDLDDYVDVLKSHGCDMDTPLVTADGFPRADIDVPTVRTTRRQIIMLRNDLKDVMKQIEQGVTEYFKHPRGDSSISTTTTAGPRTVVPFARVESVANGSPAASGGLQDGDTVVRFGSVTVTSGSGLLQLVARVVGESDKKEVPVDVLRDGQVVSLKVTPNSEYEGRGSLGCHLLPL